MQIYFLGLKIQRVKYKVLYFKNIYFALHLLNKMGSNIYWYKKYLRKYE